MPQFLNTTDDEFEDRFAALLNTRRGDALNADETAAGIIADVRGARR